MNLNKKFQIYCENNKFEINKEQIKVIDNIENFYMNDCISRSSATMALCTKDILNNAA